MLLEKEDWIVDRDVVVASAELSEAQRLAIFFT